MIFIDLNSFNKILMKYFTLFNSLQKRNILSYSINSRNFRFLNYYSNLYSYLTMKKNSEISIKGAYVQLYLC